MTGQDKHARRMKNHAYASGYHIGYAEGFEDAEKSYESRYVEMVDKGYENEIKCLKQTCNLLMEENRMLRRRIENG